VLAKAMKTVVEHGQIFGATKLVDLGGAPHTSFFMAPSYMESMDLSSTAQRSPFCACKM
jgi:hypothetical protein